MTRRTLQTLFGLAVGVAARLMLPGHHSLKLFAAVGFSLAGAIGGELLGERLFPPDAISVAGFATSALGAVASLLASGIVA